MPPVRPVRETFLLVALTIEGYDYGKGPCRQLHGDTPWTALRVRWVPVYCFPTFSLRPFAMYVALLGRIRARYLPARLHWVGTRRVALRYVSSCPPLDPYVRLSSSSLLRSKDTIMGKVHVASSMVIPHGQLYACAGYLCT